MNKKYNFLDLLSGNIFKEAWDKIPESLQERFLQEIPDMVAKDNLRTGKKTVSGLAIFTSSENNLEASDNIKLSVGRRFFVPVDWKEASDNKSESDIYREDGSSLAEAFLDKFGDEEIPVAFMFMFPNSEFVDDAGLVYEGRTLVLFSSMKNNMEKMICVSNTGQQIIRSTLPFEKETLRSESFISGFIERFVECLLTDGSILSIEQFMEKNMDEKTFPEIASLASMVLQDKQSPVWKSDSNSFAIILGSISSRLSGSSIRPVHIEMPDSPDLLTNSVLIETLGFSAGKEFAGRKAGTPFFVMLAQKDVVHGKLKYHVNFADFGDKHSVTCDYFYDQEYNQVSIAGIDKLLDSTRKRDTDFPRDTGIDRFIRAIKAGYESSMKG